MIETTYFQLNRFYNSQLCTSVFTPSSRDGKPFAESPVHVVSPEQFSAAEQRHEQERIIAKHVKEKEVAKDTEALRVSIEQLREVMFYFNLLRGKGQSRGNTCPGGYNQSETGHFRARLCTVRYINTLCQARMIFPSISACFIDYKTWE